jgi:hypothetical protein
MQLEQAAEHGDMTVLQAVLKSDSQVATVVQVGSYGSNKPSRQSKTTHAAVARDRIHIHGQQFCMLADAWCAAAA